MQRWWIIPVAVVGVALGLLLLARPDTGGEVADLDPVAELDDEGEAPDLSYDGNGIPIRGGKKLGDAVDAENRRGANPYAKAAAEARDTPEANAATHLQSGVARIRRATAALLPLRCIVPMLMHPRAHEQSDHVVARALQQARGHRAIHTSRHRQHDTRHKDPPQLLEPDAQARARPIPSLRVGLDPFSIL